MKYYIENNEKEVWCRQRMKPSTSEDIPRNYRTYGYWSSDGLFKDTKNILSITLLFLAMRMTGIKCSIKRSSNKKEEK